MICTQFSLSSGLTRFVFLNNAGFPAAAKAITEEAKYENYIALVPSIVTDFRK
jgi:hypothetical protein